MSLKSTAQNLAASLYQRRYDKKRKAALAQTGRKPGVLFTSTSRSELGSNMLCVHRRMCELGMDATHRIMFDLHASIADAQSIGAQLAFIDKLAAADVIFCDDYHPFLYLIDYPQDVKVVQLWHAVGSFKTIGFARHRENAAEHQQQSRAHRSYTHVIVSAECDRPHYAEAFGLPIERIHATGVPRIDLIADAGWQQEARAKFLQTLGPEQRRKRIVLFAPTFRGEDVRAASYDFSQLDLERLAAWCRQSGSLLLLKFHPFTQGRPQIPAELVDVVCDISTTREVNEVLPAAELLITDYSSVVYEASLLEIPMVFYAYDLEEYQRTRGFFEPYRDFVCGPVASDMDGLMAALDAGDDKTAVKAFRAKHFAHLDAHSTDRVIDLVFNGVPAR